MNRSKWLKMEQRARKILERKDLPDDLRKKWQAVADKGEVVNGLAQAHRRRQAREKFGFLC